MRLYAHDMLVEDSEVADVEDGALWAAEGDGISIETFESATDFVRIGPNHACNDGSGPDVGQRARWVRVDTIVDATDVQIQPGTLGCYLVDVTSQDDVSIGRGGTPSGTNVPRPYNRIHWDELTDDGPGVEILTMTDCNGPDINKCVGDVDDDGVVNVNDLLDVINNWGSCAALGSCCINNVCHLDFTEDACDTAQGVFYADTNADPLIDNSFNRCRDPQIGDCYSEANSCSAACVLPPNTCYGDIIPEERGNRAVDINDLLLVINTWGCTASVAGERAPDPYTDCEEYCAGIDPTYGATYASCIGQLH